MHEVGIIVFFKLMILFTIKFFFDYYIFDIKFSILPLPKNSCSQL
jgi:hypothetical protein